MAIPLSILLSACSDGVDKTVATPASTTGPAPQQADTGPATVPPATFPIDPNRITVSGISAGGMMAHQLHIAYPDLFSGAAAIAAGPYGCADGSLATAMARCMADDAGGLPVAEFAERILSDAAAGRIGDPADLTDDRVWLFHGTNDRLVAAGVNDALADLYADFLPAGQIRYVNDIPAAHHFPAAGRGHGCDESKPPFVGNCDYDAAGALLQFLYPGLTTPPETTDPEPALREVTLPGAARAGLRETAYLYVPPACRDTVNTPACGLHLVLHGCAQSSVQVDTAFIEQSGYLRWAGMNNLVLAFPQVDVGAANPYACWDWWGYTGAEYRWRDGAQMALIAGWIRELAGITTP
ncbi:PHB depolymerase family esterase [Wenzhouxiangellaceae bacterium CH-27]|uniref:PHB depolymerase family esterase n=1 Tax=Elongatibacter sediminis TaxID=3119006 RepID=A0AAW9RI15_9GAMM